MNNAMPPEELKELNEKNLEGRIEWSCWENQQWKKKLVDDLSKTTQKLRWNYTTTNVWIAKKNEEMHNSISGETENYLHFETREEKILELLQRESWWTLEEWIKSWRTTMKNAGNKRMTR